MHYQAVIDFWFDEIDASDRWKKEAAFDRLIRDRFGDLLHSAARCELFEWRATPLGRLAEILVLDQFSRNIYRERPESFAQDPLALCLAQQAVALKIQDHLSLEQKAFLYMPFMHSESALIHQLAVRLFAEPGLEDNYRFELHHRQIIERFGRYPHRNTILGRVSTAEEVAFLKQPGSSF